MLLDRHFDTGGYYPLGIDVVIGARIRHRCNITDVEKETSACHGRDDRNKIDACKIKFAVELWRCETKKRSVEPTVWHGHANVLVWPFRCKEQKSR